MEYPNSINQPILDFTLLDLDRKPHTLSAYQNQVVVLNFWSAECPWVARTDIELKKYQEEWGKQVIVLPIAPNANESLEMLSQEAQKRGWPVVLLDPAREITERFGAETTPHLFVIDAMGILRYQGAFDDVTFRQKTPNRHYLKEAVDAVLAEKKPAIAETAGYGCSIVYYAED